MGRYRRGCIAMRRRRQIQAHPSERPILREKNGDRLVPKHGHCAETDGIRFEPALAPALANESPGMGRVPSCLGSTQS